MNVNVCRMIGEYFECDILAFAQMVFQDGRLGVSEVSGYDIIWNDCLSVHLPRWMIMGCISAKITTPIRIEIENLRDLDSIQEDVYKMIPRLQRSFWSVMKMYLYKVIELRLQKIGL